MWEKHIDLFYYKQEKAGPALRRENSQQHIDMP